MVQSSFFRKEEKSTFLSTSIFLDSPTFRHRTFRHQDTLTPPFLTPRHYDYKIFWHRDILTPRHFATQTLCHPDIVPLHTNQDILTPRHFAPKTFCHSSHLDTKTFWQFPISGLTNPSPPQKKLLESPFLLGILSPRG